MNTPLYQSLDDAGLNLQAVLALDALPPAVAEALPGHDRYSRLLLVGHAGPLLWQQLQASPLRDGVDPIDSYTREQITAWLAARLPGSGHLLLYPGGEACPPLQALGRLAGWHHTSPFRIGINNRHGSWFAYRAVVLIDAELALTAAGDAGSPCGTCTGAACVAACPAGALGSEYSLGACIDYRLQVGSPCARQCPARLACPVGAEHRYPPDQIRYAYGRSLQAIRTYNRGG